MKPTGNEEAFVLRTLGDLIARGEALLEARRNPATGEKTFPDFSEAYHRWNIAGKDLVARLSGPSAANEWSAGWVRAMQSLDQLVPYCLREQQRQQAMLVELHQRFGSGPADGAAQGASESAPPPSEAVTPKSPQAGGVEGPARGKEDADRLYKMKPISSELTNEQLLEDLRRVAMLLGKKTVTIAEYPLKGRFAPWTFKARFGLWKNALAAAGLELASGQKVPTEELFENLARVWQALGRQPVRRDMVKPLSAFSRGIYVRRFGGWLPAVKAFVAWAGREGKYPEEAAAARPAATPNMPREPGLRLRFRVLQRDSFKCTVCGKTPATDPAVSLHVDHKIPWSRGGLTTFDNLATLCEKCNLGKGDSELRE